MLFLFFSCHNPVPDLYRIEDKPMASFSLDAPYWMTFHQCDTQTVDCMDPMKHETRIASSQDGKRWSVLSSIEPFQGSVPDVLIRDQEMYVFSLPKLHRMSPTEKKEQIAHFHVLDDKDDLVLQVDPSPIIDKDGKIVLFFLVGIAGVDPARCPRDQRSCTKEFRSATEIEGTQGKRFRLDPGIRAEIQISQGHFASDPDVFLGPDGYYLYVSRGAQVQALHSQDLRGTYTSIPSLSGGMLSRNNGGVPAGYFDAEKNMFYTFITRHKGGHRTEIHGATHSDFSRPLTERDFSPVITPQLLGNPNLTIASPGMIGQ
ncbi:MAG: hypothetical protein CL916_05220 [Deltaproteobacteria bacterium]|nr:hypothetical protein [Deltaproteobacteria bacterium]